MTISHNIKNLRYFYVNSKYGRVEITLDIAHEYPKKLQVYKVEYYNDRWKYSGIIQGPEDKVE